MKTLLSGLGADLPVIAAPMAGGPSTPALVTAAARAGGLGFLAGGYRTAQALAGQIHTTRAEGVPFGVNLFVPNPVPISADAYRSYARAVRAEADRYGLTLPAGPVEDDDHWTDKIDLLTSAPVPWVSFTFGIPDRAVVSALRTAGITVLQSVTSADEACLAAASGVDALIVQAPEAGGHSATLTPARPPRPVRLTDLVTAVRRAVALPVIAAGGITTAADVRAALAAGAEAVMVGTALLRTHESGASAPHKAALVDPAFTTTTVTRAFTGRPARALRNHFTDRYDAVAPAGYPAVHHLTGPLRKAATAAGDTRLIHLWAGTGYRHARAEPAADTLARLAARL
ncbi:MULTISPECIES: nitronate monooxygenase [Streptomycetaceae]|uniref:Propionate 3-nitronate monooxygenase n=1 Tax=Streptantibioticus cattleyicolor (strain ATCC 35852 / DSM 46488 / JCM 4925 / NBRC 14057 / NRRL 8057) TaxID=1003195 RepID=F8JQW1_STREN|nr:MULTISPECIES: nitronate monooxygenase [Streptomycetaceae]AEW92851.1 2-nitropropane dioxygenase [Streptantibioticus cattleyicolor NRRL 8057 = DSM 46488]MYS57606.1 nitronate monooxygenase [Streptomyces sp. SID5468]CCB73204.1 2-nitropropane dioxygenase-like enzyme [Streptantibioticus cattleyicolor NRRL 8057 = DSM 46488]